MNLLNNSSVILMLIVWEDSVVGASHGFHAQRIGSSAEEGIAIRTPISKFHVCLASSKNGCWTRSQDSEAKLLISSAENSATSRHSRRIRPVNLILEISNDLWCDSFLHDRYGTMVSYPAIRVKLQTTADLYVITT